MDYMGGTESNVSRDANISGTHTFPNFWVTFSNLKLQLILWVVRVLCASNSYWVTVSLWGIVSGFNLTVSCQLMILCGRIPVHILCHDLRWCQLVRHYNEPTFRTVTRIQPSTQEGLDAPWTTGAAQEIPVDRHLKGFSRASGYPSSHNHKGGNPE